MNWTIDEASPMALSGSMAVKGAEDAVSNVDVVDAIMRFQGATKATTLRKSVLTVKKTRLRRPSICTSRNETGVLAVEQ